MPYDRNNILAKIIRNELPSTKLYEDADVLAIRDIAPRAPVHLLISPKGEYASFHDFAMRATPETVAHFFTTIATLAESLGLAGDGYRLVTNHGAFACQAIPHFHMHLLAGKQLQDIPHEA